MIAGAVTVAFGVLVILFANPNRGSEWGWLGAFIIAIPFGLPCLAAAIVLAFIARNLLRRGDSVVLTWIVLAIAGLTVLVAFVELVLVAVP